MCAGIRCRVVKISYPRLLLRKRRRAFGSNLSCLSTLSFYLFTKERKKDENRAKNGETSGAGRKHLSRGEATRLNGRFLSACLIARAVVRSHNTSQRIAKGLWKCTAPGQGRTPTSMRLENRKREKTSVCLNEEEDRKSVV